MAPCSEEAVFFFGKIFDSHIGVRDCWWELDDGAEEGVLHEDCLPDFASLLHLVVGIGVWIDDGRVSVEADGIGLPLKGYRQASEAWLSFMRE